MFKILILLCVVLLQQNVYCQQRVPNPSNCAEGKCCPPGLNEPLNQGEKAADQKGKCQTYVCNYDNTYTINQCAYYTGCITVQGNPKKQYPACCTQLKPGVKQPDGCSGVA